MSPNKSCSTTRCVAGPTDHDRGLLFSSAPSHWASTKAFACSQATSFNSFISSCTTKLRSQLRHELPLCCLQTRSTTYVNRVTGRVVYMVGVLYEKRGNCRFKFSPEKCFADTRKSQLLTELKKKKKKSW